MGSCELLAHRERGGVAICYAARMPPSLEPVARYMSAVPISIQQTAPLSDAIALMEEHQIRHLPVLDGKAAVGVVSERDLASAGSLVPDGLGEISVAEVMTPDPYSVLPDTTIAEVAKTMAKQRYGAVLVADAAGQLLGLFTTTDALYVLAGGAD